MGKEHRHLQNDRYNRETPGQTAGSQRGGVGETETSFEQADSQPFLMPIEDIFSITGRGVVVVGRVQRGKVRVGEEVEIVGLRQTRRTVVIGLEMYKRVVDEAFTGDNVGIVLRDLSKYDLERGMVVAKPGYATPQTMSRADGDSVSSGHERNSRVADCFDSSSRQAPTAFDLSASEASRLFGSVIDGKHFLLPAHLQYPKLLSISQDAHVKNIEDIRLIVGKWVFTKSSLIIRGFLGNKEIPYDQLPDWDFSLWAGPEFATDRFLQKLTNQDSRILFLNGHFRNGSSDSISIGHLPDSLMVKFHQSIVVLQTMTKR